VTVILFKTLIIEDNHVIVKNHAITCWQLQLQLHVIEGKISQLQLQLYLANCD